MNYYHPILTRPEGRALIWVEFRALTSEFQEYFVPVGHLEDFVPRMTAIFQKHKVNVLNVSIRHALPDTNSIMAWAREEIFALVVYYKQGTTQNAKDNVSVWTRELIDAALAVNGTYYLPYQLHATPEQFLKAYPRAPDFFAYKIEVDPNYRFRNKLWDTYFPPSKNPLPSQQRQEIIKPQPPNLK